jgi:hypothetical protein
MRGKPLTLHREQETGCIVPTSHKLNQDGYLRLKLRGGHKMFHRYIWERTNGEVPEGFEIHHKCHNRACCNLEHLELVNIVEHKVEHNSTRYLERYEEAYSYWKTTGCTGTKLGELYGVTFSTGCRWIREWKSRD